MNKFDCNLLKALQLIDMRGGIQVLIWIINYNFMSVGTQAIEPFDFQMAIEPFRSLFVFASSNCDWLR